MSPGLNKIAFWQIMLFKCKPPAAAHFVGFLLLGYFCWIPRVSSAMMQLTTTVLPYLAILSCTAALPHITRDGAPGLALQMAQSIMAREQGILSSQQDASALLQAGFIQKAFHALGAQTRDDKVQESLDAYITKSLDSVVPVLSNATQDTHYPLDRLSNGNGLLQAWQEKGEEKYKASVDALRESVDLQPRNAEGGLWYYVYPYWSYLDGMYSYGPFMTAYTDAFGNSSYKFDDIVLQFDLLWQHCFNNKTGLLVHGYDARRTAVWANKDTGASPHVWGRSLGWYCMALIDTIEHIPPKAQETRNYLETRFRHLMAAVTRAADPKTGGWWQILDQPGREGNYIESSGSSMFVYALLKGLRLGALHEHKFSPVEVVPEAYEETARKAYRYIAKTFVVDDGSGTLGWNGTVGVCSLNSTADYEVCI